MPDSTRERTTLAMVGGFSKARDELAHGTHHASYAACAALAKTGAFSEIHVYRQTHDRALSAQTVLPPTPPCRVFDKTRLAITRDRYPVIYVANGEQIGPAPHLLRPHHDWAPVVTTIGTTHAGPQWSSLLVALASGAIRSTDGFIFKSSAARNLFRTLWDDWTGRVGAPLAFPQAAIVLPNGADVELDVPEESRRAATRQRLRLSSEDVVFLAFSRLSPGTKGDQLALLVRWREVLQRFPRAFLLLAGAEVDRSFTEEQRSLARAVGIANRVQILANPYESFPDARRCLMSAADVFVHLTTGVEEASPLVIQEALAHALPVIATDWAGNSDVINDGDNGFLIDTRAGRVAPEFTAATFGVTDLPIALAAARSVTTDFQALVSRAASFADPDRRRRMAAAARASAEARSLPKLARAHLGFFQDVSRAAQGAWTGAAGFTPLVQMDQVLEAQTGGRLRPTDLIRLANPDRTYLLFEGSCPESADRVTRALETLTAPTSLGHLATLLVDEDPHPGDSVFAAAMGSIVRLLNYGVIELVKDPR